MHTLVGAALAVLLVPLLPAAATTAPAVGAEPGWATGVVVDRGGAPLPGALVNALDSFEVADAGTLEDGLDRFAVTDARGRFRVRQAPGGYLLQVCVPHEEGGGHRSARDHPSCEEQVSTAGDFAITYDGPDGATDSWLLQHRLWPATTGTRDVGTVPVAAAGEVRGRVRGLPAGQVVQIMRTNGTQAFSIKATAGGRYRLPGMVPGRYYLQAGGDGTRPWRSAPVDVAGDAVTVVDGEVRRGGAVTGRVVGLSGQAVEASVLVVSGEQVVASADTDALGRYRVTGLPPGAYRVGLPEPDGRHLPGTVDVRVGGDGSSVAAPLLRLSRGGTVEVTFTGPGRRAEIADELRDSSGEVVRSRFGDGAGHAVYRGLRPGLYRAYAAVDGRYGVTEVVVGEGETTVEATLGLTRSTLVVRGRTAPRATISIAEGGQCPSTAPTTIGAFGQITSADTDGRYEVRGLVPGRYVVQAQSEDGWVPRCRAGVEISRTSSLGFGLVEGASVVGRLVYAGTTRPLITELSYQVGYGTVTRQDPTAERPSYDRTTGATGRFRIAELRPGRVTGFLATETGEGVNDVDYQVVLPFQDGTPYWYDVAPRRFTVPGPSGVVDLGDVGLRLNGGRVSR